MTDLPQGWEWSTVGELGEYVNGRGFKKSEWSNAGRPIIRIQNLTGSGSAFNYFAGELEDRYVVPTGALLISWAATLGVYRWDGPEGALNQHIFRVDSFINEDFHRYLLEHALDLMQSDTHGSGMVHITRGRFDATPAPLPPSGEQERIVLAIEEALSKVAAGEAGVRTVRQLLKRMRGAVLGAAVTGRLVPQDPTDTPATKLLADLGVTPIELTDSKRLPDGWAGVKVGDILDDIEAGKSFATLGRPAGDGEIGVVKVSAMTWGAFRPEENKAIPLHSKIDDRWIIRGGRSSLLASEHERVRRRMRPCSGGPSEPDP
jgi:type I restriction enzyme S subunit